MNRLLSIPFSEAAACPVCKLGPPPHVHAMLHALRAKMELSSQISARKKRFNSGRRNYHLEIQQIRNNTIQAHHSKPCPWTFSRPGTEPRIDFYKIAAFSIFFGQKLTDLASIWRFLIEFLRLGTRIVSPRFFPAKRKTNRLS